MKIAFLLGSPDISGGTFVIFEHAARLGRMGYAVTIVTVERVEPQRYAWHPLAGELRWKSFADIGGELFDVAIATWWQSIFHLSRLRSCNYVYFVQSIESRFFPDQDKECCELRDIDVLAAWCENTYRYPLPVITEASWIQRYLKERFNRVARIAVNGMRKDLFNAEGPCLQDRVPGRLRVLVEGPLAVFYKNVERTIELCRQACVDEVWLLTSTEIHEYPGVDRCFSRIAVGETGDIYRSCDVLVKLSYVEGMFGPPLEMFHCGGTAIVYNVTGHEEYIVDGVNAIVVNRDDEAAVVSWLHRLRFEPELLAELKRGAVKTAAFWPDWETASARFAGELLACATETQEMPVAFLQLHDRHFLEIRDNTFAQRGLQRLAERESATVSGAYRNCVQVYCDCGAGLIRELRDGYTSGRWSICQVVQDELNGWVRIRIDPSVLIGVVIVRAIRVSDKAGGDILAQWQERGCWDDVEVAGTAVCLSRNPLLVIEAYGEDPQLVLPVLSLPGTCSSVLIEIEVFEDSFRQAITSGYPVLVGNFGQSLFRRVLRIARKYWRYLLQRE